MTIQRLGILSFLVLVLGTLAVVGAESIPAAQRIIPEDRLTDWRPGSTVGVPGGIPTTRVNLIDVTKPPYNADNTGASDSEPAISKALAAAKAQDVVYLPAGTYRVNKGIAGKSNVTIRGDGPEKTHLVSYQPSGSIIGLGGGGADWWYPNRQKFSISGSPAKGATVLMLGDTKALDNYPNHGIGQICRIAPKNDPALPVVALGNFEYMRSQECRIVERTPTSITIAPPLLFDLPESLAPILRPGGLAIENAGVEDLSVDGANSKTPHGLIGISGFGCWVKNVQVLNTPNYHISVSDALRCEVRHCYIARRKGTGSNGAGILVGTSSSCLFEDNVLVEQFPHIEVNGSSGNVFGYNYCHDSAVPGILGCSIDSNHGPHCSFNLYEGNVCQRFQCDGYHGSASHDTVYRNWIMGTSEKVREFWVCVNLNRFTRHYSLLGNILGQKGQEWLYESPQGFGYDQHLIYALGFPGMGNGGFAGNAQPSKGKNWADWERMLASEHGKGPGPNGFQEMDLDVAATTLRKGNFNYKDNAVPASEALDGQALPPSLYRTEKPLWFGNLNWPALGPDTTFESNKIPAQERFEALRKVSSEK